MPKFCSSPWTTIDINTGGLVTPCLCSDWHTHGSIGNLNDNTLEEVLVSSSMQEFRLTILNGSFSKCNTVCHRLANLEDVEKIEHKTTDLNLPTHINIALDKECNLKCPICRNGKVFTGQVNYKILNILQKLTSAYKNFQKKVRIQCDGAGDLFASKSYLKWLWQDDLPNCFELDASSICFCNFLVNSFICCLLFRIDSKFSIFVSYSFCADLNSHGPSQFPI